MSEHGRLLALKDILTSLTENKKLEDEQLVCFYAKDISVVRGVTECEEETVEEIISSVPDESEIRQVIEKREAQQKFSNDRIFRQGTMEIKDELVKIRDSILTKDGIVSTEKQDLFREQLQRTFNNDLIRAMAANPV